MTDDDRCGCALKNDWSDTEADAGECLDENPDGWGTCSKPDGHDGPHVACGVREHPMEVWADV